LMGQGACGSNALQRLCHGDVKCYAAAAAAAAAAATQVAGERIGSSVTGMLAVQVAGATIGNMICINNILSAKAVMNMAHVPGARHRGCYIQGFGGGEQVGRCGSQLVRLGLGILRENENAWAVVACTSRSSACQARVEGRASDQPGKYRH